MISEKQLAERSRSLGSSDAHILAGIEGPGGKTLVDLWCSKNRGPELEIPPLVPPEPPPDCALSLAVGLGVKVDPRVVGNAFESSVIALYEAATGTATTEADTITHDCYPWARANPDRIVYDDRAQALFGVEAKLVGQWGAPLWGSDGIPDSVAIQAQWSMAVSGLSTWDVVAWIAGTDVRIVRTHRDDDVCRTLLDLGEQFWINHILADEAPEPLDVYDARNLIQRRWPKDNGTMIECDVAGGIADCIVEVKAKERALKQERQALEASLIKLVGENKGLKGDWGKYTFATQNGRVGWKALAYELANGAIDADKLDDHRAEPYRVGRLTMAKGR